jgi:hypothetical protein
MSDSYPTIQDTLSDMQKEFMGCVEMHLDPPEDDTNRYLVEAVFKYDAPECELPGNAIKFTIAVDESDLELMMRRHTIEFLELDEDGGYHQRVGHVLHMMKRVEAALGRYFWTETQFEVHGPDVPREQRRQAEVEAEVKLYVDRVRALDRGRKLVPA